MENGRPAWAGTPDGDAGSSKRPFGRPNSGSRAGRYQRPLCSVSNILCQSESMCLILRGGACGPYSAGYRVYCSQSRVRRHLRSHPECTSPIPPSPPQCCPKVAALTWAWLALTGTLAHWHTGDWQALLAWLVWLAGLARRRLRPQPVRPVQCNHHHADNDIERPTPDTRHQAWTLRSSSTPHAHRPRPRSRPPFPFSIRPTLSIFSIALFPTRCLRPPGADPRARRSQSTPKTAKRKAINPQPATRCSLRCPDAPDVPR